MNEVRIPGGTVGLLVMEDNIKTAPRALVGMMKGAASLLRMAHRDPTDEERRAWALVPQHLRLGLADEAKRRVPGGVIVTWTEGVATGPPRNVRWGTYMEIRR